MDRTSKTSSNACLPCRKVKMKCSRSADEMKCDRCTRKSLSCTFREHRRGRKPGMRLIPKANRVAAEGSSLESSQKRRTSLPGQGAMTDSMRSGSVPDFWARSEGLQPAGLLSHQAMKGKFSLQNILSTDHGPSDQSESPPIPANDPIALGLVNYQVALCLFENFMEKLNRYISQLDPLLHTLPYVRQRSPFLLTSILTASAKAFNPALYPSLHGHTEELFTDCFRRGTKSTETVQAILILTYWKEPKDSRAWMSLGFAIRMCMDLGWHKLVPEDFRSKREVSELQLRETRNVERTWLVLFVYDRSISLQTGKPWMIERNDVIESIESWLKDPLASPDDGLLSGFVALRLLTIEVFELVTPHGQYHVSRHDRLLAILHSRLATWQNKWLKVVGTGNCHSFLIQFYGLHARLQLFSIPLQKALESRNLDDTCDLKAFWVSYQSAIDMLRLTTEFSSLLYFVQDSVHVMTAYAVIFLIKLLLSAPTGITRELESNTIKTIHEAAITFSKQAAPPSSSCNLQARFLERVIHEFSTARHRPSFLTPYGVAHPEIPATHDPNQSLDLPQVPYQEKNHRHQQNSLALLNNPISEIRGEMDAESDFIPGTDKSPSFLFGDEDIWVDMFANAGFDIQDGVFFA